ncbi:hypothetical protein E2562_023831 [Oryza meyeriana var. granulata]|uniref:Uncharacterized protein n=1 Tax=Oryza meyeriana var. granulata TaxID=110450 RepID=A0A6G1D712_9ORYZ|nr:hypothetical protein E2562_023831 [Oryza meyeriana var. granulata]
MANPLTLPHPSRPPDKASTVGADGQLLISFLVMTAIAVAVLRHPSAPLDVATVLIFNTTAVNILFVFTSAVESGTTPPLCLR